MQTGVPGAELAGRTALVTGSSHGIGTVVARELARCGAAVAVHGRDAAAAASVADDIRQSGGTSVAVTGDVTDVGALERIREEVHEGIGTIDVLVAAAAAATRGPRRSKTSRRMSGGRRSTAICWRRS